MNQEKLCSQDVSSKSIENLKRKVTAAVIIENGKVLITRRAPKEKLHGKWEFPGGKLEEGETLAQCLKRELNEELGINIEVGEVFGESFYKYSHGEFILIGLYAKIINGTIKLSVHDRYEWVNIKSLKEYDFAPADIPFVDKLLSTYKDPPL